MQRLRIVSFLLVLLSTAAQQYVAFDAASASSTYSVGNLAGSPAFGAQQALSGGSGYWQIVFDMCHIFLNSVTLQFNFPNFVTLFRTLRRWTNDTNLH